MVLSFVPQWEEDISFKSSLFNSPGKIAPFLHLMPIFTKWFLSFLASVTRDCYNTCYLKLPWRRYTLKSCPPIIRVNVELVSNVVGAVFVSSITGCPDCYVLTHERSVCKYAVWTQHPSHQPLRMEGPSLKLWTPNPHWHYWSPEKSSLSLDIHYRLFTYSCTLCRTFRWFIIRQIYNITDSNMSLGIRKMICRPGEIPNLNV